MTELQKLVRAFKLVYNVKMDQELQCQKKLALAGISALVERIVKKK